MKRIVTTISVLFLAGFAFSQDCQECKKRSFWQYDFNIINSTPNGSDSIPLYVKALNITSGLGNYYRNEEPTKDCILYIAIERMADSLSYKSYPLFPESPGAHTVDNYILFGHLAYDLNTFSMLVRLETALSRERVTSAALTINSNLSVLEMAREIGAALGPLYNVVMEFEKKKRDEGAPYAIYPEIKITASKTKLDFNESTSVSITATDCDGFPLKNRTIQLTADGGTLTEYSVTTDADGKADVVFTAGTEPLLADIQGEFNYTAPWGEELNAEIEPLGISIKKPADAWFIQVSYETNHFRKSENKAVKIDQGDVSHSEERGKVIFSAWFKTLSLPVAGPNINNGYLQVKYKAFNDISGNSYDWYHNIAGGHDRKSSQSIHSKSLNTSEPELRFNWDEEKSQFSIDDIDMVITGGYNYVEDYYNNFNPDENEHKEGFVETDPDGRENGHIQTLSKDTSFTTTNDDGISHEQTTVTQTCVYGKEYVKINYQQNYISQTKIENEFFKESSEWKRDRYVKVLLYFNDDLTNAADDIKVPSRFNLFQNYPNPFKPSTVIQYEIKKLDFVTLKIYDILGNEISTLVDKEMPAGEYSVVFNAEKLTGGIYFYTLRAGNYNQTKKMVLLR